MSNVTKIMVDLDTSCPLRGGLVLDTAGYWAYAGAANNIINIAAEKLITKDLMINLRGFINPFFSAIMNFV